MFKQRENQKQPWHVQETLVKFLSFVCVSGTYGLLAISLVQAYILVSWLRN